MQCLVLCHFVHERQVLARRGHLKRSARGVLSKGVDQNDIVLAVLVVKVLVQAEARIELAEVSIGRDEVGEVPVIEAPGVVDLAWSQCAANETPVL